MAFVNEPGRYFLQVKEANWSKDDSGKPYLYLRLVADQVWRERGENGDWVGDVKGLEISAYCRPFKKDGKKNRGFEMQMKAAFGFDGVDFEPLKPEKLVGQFVQASVESDPEKPGRVRVGWIDHHSATGERTEEDKPETIDVADVAKMFASATSEGDKPVPPVQATTGRPMPPARK